DPIEHNQAIRSISDGHNDTTQQCAVLSWRPKVPVIQFSSVASEVSCVISADYRSRGWTESSYTAAVRGVVTDASGGAIPGVTVTVTESDRNVPHTVTTDNAGRYVVTALPPGEYTLSVELSGFKTYTHTNIPLAVQQQATF